jgi:hypothetical protein
VTGALGSFHIKFNFSSALAFEKKIFRDFPKINPIKNVSPIVAMQS